VLEATQNHIQCHSADKIYVLDAGLVDQELAGEKNAHIPHPGWHDVPSIGGSRKAARGSQPIK
jgi:hypothetical protein